MGQVMEGMAIPVIVRADRPDQPLAELLAEEVAGIRRALGQDGAVLLRGFAVFDAGQFEDSVRPLLGELMDYVEGASPRIELSPGVYTSTEYAPDQTVALHNELSYSHAWPGLVAFCCLQPAADGGATPIADSRAVLRRLSPELVERFRGGVRYVRHMHSGKGAGVGWKTVFGTDDKEAAEQYCAEAGIDYEWLPGDTLKTSQVRPATAVHPETGEASWFNQAHQWHPSNAGPETEQALREVFGDRLPMNVTFGAGDEIGPDDLAEIRQAYAAERIEFPWEQGDVMVVDNMLTAHGRTPFRGERRVVVAMGRPVALADLVSRHG
jgi:hypothetical protein